MTTTPKPTTVDAAAQASIGAATRELHLPTVRADANGQQGGGDEWAVGFDSMLLEQVTADLEAQSRLADASSSDQGD